MSGPIPPEIGNLKNLVKLYVQNNPGLIGTVSPVCGAQVYMMFTNSSQAMNTSLSAICGCAASSNIPIFLPNLDMVSMACLSVSNYDSSLWFDCKFDANKNPLQDCLNSFAFFCGISHIEGNPNRIQGCKERVDDYFSQMGPLWQTWRRNCGQWTWTDGHTGNVESSECASAETAVNGISGYSQTVILLKQFLWYHAHL